MERERVKVIKAKLEKALNEQINKEFYSAYLYMSMSTHSASIGLKGISGWFMAQYHEEMFHAMKFYEYVGRHGGKVALKAIKAPPANFKSVLDMFEKTLKHEQSITESINNLINIAIDLKDHATHNFLQWYITEQVEEEENDNDIIAKLKLIKNDSNGLFMIDKELGSRIVNVPTDFSKGVEVAVKAIA